LVMMKKRSIFLLILLPAVLLGSCSIQKMAVGAVADALGGGTTGGTSLTGDNDPELVGDALPFALKLYEILLEQTPEHTGLLLTTGMGYVMYANAFVQSPADMMPEWEFKVQSEQYARAKNLYLRGRNYIFDAMELKYPGFRQASKGKSLAEFLQQVEAEDIDYLYWGSAGWFAAIAINVFDLELTIEIPMAKAMMDRAYELDPDYGDGTIDDFYILYYASVTPDMGGSIDKALYHFEEAVRKSDGMNAGPYLSLATSVYMQQQDVKAFVRTLEQALAIDVDGKPEIRLLNVIMQDKAEWYLQHLENFFLLDAEEDEE
jgi:predicted anti-sigma-YlaC factor YlaD